MLCGNDNILQNIPHVQFEYNVLLVPHDIVMNLNNVMS